MGDAAKSVRAIPGGIRLFVRAQPRASRSAVVGAIDDGRGGIALKVAVAAPPVEGAANEAIVELLAEVFGVPRRAVSIARGDTGRNKQIDVLGIDTNVAIARLVQLLD
jgi:uncharacterized protein (TIGR00251 family)